MTKAIRDRAATPSERPERGNARARRPAMGTGAPSAARGRRLDPDERREQLVSVGLQLLKSSSFDDLTVDEIARHAGISKGLVFHYFPTKRELQATVLRAAADELLAELVRDPDAPIEEQLTQGIDAFINYIELRPGTFVALVRSVGTDPLLNAVFDDTRAAIVQFVAERIQIVDPPPAMRVAIRAWIGMVEEATLDWLRDKAFPRADLVRFLEQAALLILPAAAELVVRSGEIDEVPQGTLDVLAAADTIAKGGRA